MPGPREERGQATVEFVLVLPLLVLGVGILIHVAAGLATQSKLEASAREGARAAAVQPESATAAASSAVRRVMGAGGAEVSVDVGDEWITVTVRAVVRFLPFGGPGRELTADATMRREDLIR